MELKPRSPGQLSIPPKRRWGQPLSEKPIRGRAARAIATASAAVLLALGAPSCYSMGETGNSKAPESGSTAQDAGTGAWLSPCGSEVPPEQDILLEEGHSAMLAPNATSIMFSGYFPESEIAQINVADVWKLPFPNAEDSKHFIEGVNSSTAIEELDGASHTITFCGAVELVDFEGGTTIVGRFVSDSGFLDCGDCPKVNCGSGMTEEFPSGGFTQQLSTNKKLSGWVPGEGETTDCPEVKTRITSQESGFEPGLESQENSASDAPTVKFLDFGACALLSADPEEGTALLGTPKGVQEVVLGGTAVCADGAEYKITELETDGTRIYGWRLSLAAIAD